MPDPLKLLNLTDRAIIMGHPVCMYVGFKNVLKMWHACKGNQYSAKLIPPQDMGTRPL